jgi:hypothetical protein
MMDGPTGWDADRLLHEPRPISRFADLKATPFTNLPLDSIPAAINSCPDLFPDEDIAIDYLPLLRLSI